MDVKLVQLAAERIETDYNGCVDNFGEQDIKLKNGVRVHKITYEDNQFHYYNRWWDKVNGKAVPKYKEIFPDDEEEEKILDEFYAWY